MAKSNARLTSKAARSGKGRAGSSIMAGISMHARSQDQGYPPWRQRNWPPRGASGAIPWGRGAIGVTRRKNRRVRASFRRNGPDPGETAAEPPEGNLGADQGRPVINTARPRWFPCECLIQPRSRRHMNTLATDYFVKLAQFCATTRGRKRTAQLASALRTTFGGASKRPRLELSMHLGPRTTGCARHLPRSMVARPDASQ